MITLMFTVLAVGWKVALIVIVAVVTFDTNTRMFMKYTNRPGLTAYAIFLVCFGLAICLWVSKHLPTDPQFWTSWYFVDDVATVSFTWGIITLIRLAQYRLLQNK